MKDSIPKNPQSTSILNKLISNGHYKGIVGSDSFELKRNHFPNNFGIYGVLAENKRFQIKADFTKPMKYLVKIFDIMGILIGLFLAFIKSNWIVVIIYFVVRLISYVYVNAKSEKEIRMFSSKFLEFERFYEKQNH